jgi:N-acetylneuraminic acid mutarotase
MKTTSIPGAPRFVFSRLTLLAVVCFAALFGIGATPSDAAVASLKSARADHRSVTLSDGRVLVFGGRAASGYLAERAELYNPLTNLWTDAGAPVLLRSNGYASTLLANGQLLVVGGYAPSTSGKTAASEIYDPALNSWRQVASTSEGYGYHTTTLLPNGRVLLVGLRGESTSSAEIYDPLADTWTRAAAPSVARFGHAATLLANGRVLVSGGTSPCSGSTEVYDPIANSWSTVGSLANPRQYHTASSLKDGRVLVVGGWWWLR